MNKVSSQPPNTTEESSQNSDIGDTKSLSPPTSVSEVSTEIETREVTVKMDVESETKISHTTEEQIEEINQEVHKSVSWLYSKLIQARGNKLKHIYYLPFLNYVFNLTLQYYF